MTARSKMVLLCVVAAIAVGIVLIRRSEAETPPQLDMPSDSQWVALFHGGVTALEQHRFPEAVKIFSRLVDDRPSSVNAWINLAAGELNRNTEATHPRCITACEEAIKRDAKRPEPYFIRGVLMKHLGRNDDAERDFKSALERAPDDPTALYFLATLIGERDPIAAISLLDKALEGETHLASAHYAIAGLKRRAGQPDTGSSLTAFKAFTESQTGSLVRIVYTELGRLGEAIRDPGVALTAIELPATSKSIETKVAVGSALAICSLSRETLPSVIISHERSLSALSPYSEAGMQSKDIAAFNTAPSRVIPGDANNDGFVDLLVIAGGQSEILMGSAKRFAESRVALTTTTPLAAATWTDIDQDSDLDIVAIDSNGFAHVFVNRRDAVFTELVPKTPLVAGFTPPELPKLAAGASEIMATDLDADGDADLLFVGRFGITLWRNDRLLRFVDVTARAGLNDQGPLGFALVSDLNHDGRLDIAALTEQGQVRAWIHTQSGPFRLTFRTGVSTKIPTVARAAALRICDFDLDGRDDLAIACVDGSVQIFDNGAAAIAGVGTLRAGIFGGALPPSDGKASWSGPVTLMVAPLQDSPDPQIIAGFADSSLLVRAIDPPHYGLAVRLVGRIEPGQTRANTGGVGARVEVMGRGGLTVRELRTNDAGGGATLVPLTFGLGFSGQADYVRITWPDDVLQNEGPVPCDQIKIIEQFQRKGSSCPVLFAWDGERFACVTDFLGTGGLGFWVAPGTFAPPDPTERVLIPPPVVPRNGRYEFRIHEPFEEACYLDMAKLLVIEHPVGTEVIPDERMAVGSSLPDGKIFTLRDRHFPLHAEDGRGRDVTNEVLQIDRRYCASVPDPRFLGYAEPTTFTFNFGKPLADAGSTNDLVMAMDGWVEYPYSHINVAAFQADVRLQAYSIDVETRDRGWVTLQTEAGYPAGLPRTMTLPLGKLPAELTGRMRLRTNQEAYIDRLSLFRPIESESTHITALDASVAELRFSGYPREYSPDGRAPRLYDYQIRDPQFPFKTLAGAFTRFGDVKELLTGTDDRSVVFGGGEEIAISFEAPPEPAAGRTRTLVLDTYGWCKDMDPYTAFPATLEPLPYVGMTEYPYPPESAPKDTEALKDYRRRFQTRVLPGSRAPR